MRTDTEIDIDEIAEALATKAVEGYCHAIWCNDDYMGNTYDSDDLITDVIDSDDYPSMKVFEAVYEAAVAYIDHNFGGPWCTEKEYRALTGADEPPDSSASTPNQIGGGND
jgi:hypothetical protein